MTYKLPSERPYVRVHVPAGGVYIAEGNPVEAALQVVDETAELFRTTLLEDYFMIGSTEQFNPELVLPPAELTKCRANLVEELTQQKLSRVQFTYKSDKADVFLYRDKRHNLLVSLDGNFTPSSTYAQYVARCVSGIVVPKFMQARVPQHPGLYDLLAEHDIVTDREVLATKPHVKWMVERLPDVMTRLESLTDDTEVVPPVVNFMTRCMEVSNFVISASQQFDMPIDTVSNQEGDLSVDEVILTQGRIARVAE